MDGWVDNGWMDGCMDGWNEIVYTYIEGRQVGR